MLGAAAITIIPTLLLYIVLPKLGFKPKSNYLMLALSWFSGMFLFTIATFLVATFLSLFATSVLLKASLEILAAFTIILLFYFHKDLKHHFYHPLVKGGWGDFFLKFSSFKFVDILLIALCLLFPVFFFSPQLSLENNAIFISPVFWDFHWLMSLTQTFAFGDNFPPQNEAFAGLPANYHYFWMVITAIYEVMGLNLVEAMNYFSILGFFFFLIALIGIAQEIFHSKLAGFLAVLLTITSSSGYFIDYFLSHQSQNVTELIVGILTNASHPFFSAVYPTNGITYNGTMFNLFYFLEERQMILGVTYLILCSWIIYKRKELSNTILLITGALMGAYFLWHLYITIMVLGALLFILAFDKSRKQTFLLLVGFGIVFLPHLFYFKQLTHSDWFTKSITEVPRFEPGFSDQRGLPFSFQHALYWYAYSYGVKLLLLPISLLWFWFKNKKAAMVISAIIIPTFILINTVQLSPADVYENHKWLRPMNIAVDLAIAAFIVSIFFSAKQNPAELHEKWDKTLQRTLSTLPIWTLIIFLLTASGFIELMPYLNAKPSQFFSYYPSPITAAVESDTPPKAVFIGVNDKEIFLAGRKVFLANQLRGHDTALDRTKRMQITTQIYTSRDLKSFCSLTKEYGIDYVEFLDSEKYPFREFLLTLPGFSSLNQNYEKVYFADADAACGSHKTNQNATQN